MLECVCVFMYKCTPLCTYLLCFLFLKCYSVLLIVVLFACYFFSTHKERRCAVGGWGGKEDLREDVGGKP